MNNAKKGREALHAAPAVVAALLLLAAPAWSSPAGDSEPGERPRVVRTTFESVDATIAGQWDFPQNSPAPLVVLIPASTSLDRNGRYPGMREDPANGMYARLADQLVAEGFAVFRFDNPGTGRSGRGRYATARSNALEAYRRAVDHARIDPEHVFLLGHSAGTQAIAGIYSRYEAILPPAGVVLLASAVEEREAVQIKAPALIIVGSKNPDDRYQYGEFAAEARTNEPGAKLKTDLVMIKGADHALLSLEKDSNGAKTSLNREAIRALLHWLMKHRG